MALLDRFFGKLAGERLRIELRPASVSLAGHAGFKRSRVLYAHAIETERAKGSSEHPAEPWRVSLDALAAGLRDQRGALGRVEVVLSDHFVRYVLIPWSESVVSDSERLAYARLSLRDVYGHLSDTWDLSVDQQPAGQASFACGVDRALLAGLRDVVSHAGGRLESVTPALVDCFNRHRPALKAPEFCLAIAEPGRISLAFRLRGGWQAVRSRRIEGSLPETLPTLLKQEAVAGSAPEGGALYLCAANIDEVPPFAVQGWRLTRLVDSGSAGHVSGPTSGQRHIASPLAPD
jgi:hypothetical protein